MPRDVVSVEIFFFLKPGVPTRRKNGEQRFRVEKKTRFPLSPVSLLMPLDFELTRLDSSPPELRAGASVTVYTSTGQVSLNGVVFATLSAEDIAKVSSSSSISNPFSATVRTIRRDKDSISSVTIRIVVPDTQQARQQHQHQQQQPRQGKSLYFVSPSFQLISIDGDIFLVFKFIKRKKNDLDLQLSARLPLPLSTRTSSRAASPRPSSTPSRALPESSRPSGTRARARR